MNAKKVCAQVIRILSVPPVMITLLILILYGYNPFIFRGWSDVVISILLLGIIPVFAYPFQMAVPSLKKGERNTQRKLAFIFTLIGYTIALIWSLVSKASTELLLICSTYCISIVLLTICNKLIHIRAGGHACSFTGPLLFLIYFIDWKLCFPCFLIALLIVWSSLYLKRHTKKDLAMGSLACILSFLLSYLIIN